MLGIKSENKPIEGRAASELLEGIIRRSQGVYTQEECEQKSRDEEILNRFEVTWN